jgi:hypothetical protein
MSPGRSSQKKLIAFGWYGGKFSHLGWLLDHLPDCHHYCEPFAGSAAVLLNRAPAPVETYNDIDGEVTNFFRVLRDETDELLKAIALTPFSREEFYRAVSEEETGLSDRERAPVFCAGPAGANRAGPARFARTLGELQEYEPGRNVRCGLPLAGKRGGPAGNRRAVAPRPDRESPRRSID